MAVSGTKGLRLMLTSQGGTLCRSSSVHLAGSAAERSCSGSSIWSPKASASLFLARDAAFPLLLPQQSSAFSLARCFAGRPWEKRGRVKTEKRRESSPPSHAAANGRGGGYPVDRSGDGRGPSRGARASFDDRFGGRPERGGDRPHAGANYRGEAGAGAGAQSGSRAWLPEKYPRRRPLGNVEGEEEVDEDTGSGDAASLRGSESFRSKGKGGLGWEKERVGNRSSEAGRGGGDSREWGREGRGGRESGGWSTGSPASRGDVDTRKGSLPRESGRDWKGQNYGRAVDDVAVDDRRRRQEGGGWADRRSGDAAYPQGRSGREFRGGGGAEKWGGGRGGRPFNERPGGYGGSGGRREFGRQGGRGDDWKGGQGRGRMVEDREVRGEVSEERYLSGRDRYRVRELTSADEGYVPELKGEGVYGLSSVRAAIQAQRRKFFTLYVRQTSEDPPKGAAKKKDAAAFQGVIAAAREAGIDVVETTKHALNMMSDNRPHQGLILDAEPLEFETLKALPIPTRAEGAPTPVWLALDEVVDPQNFGAVMRSAFFLGAAGVLTCARNSAPPSPVVSRASAGAMEVMPAYSVSTMFKFLEKCANEGWRVLGASADPNAIPVSEIEKGPPTVLVLGNEGVGLRTNVKKACTAFVRIDGLPFGATRNAGASLSTEGEGEDEETAEEEDVSDAEGEGEGKEWGDVEEHKENSRGETEKRSVSRPRSATVVDSLNVSVAAGILLHELRKAPTVGANEGRLAIVVNGDAQPNHAAKGKGADDDDRESDSQSSFEQAKMNQVATAS